MTLPEPQQDAATPADAIPAKTTPTWEMEMLLSGATVFGLLQLPDALHGVTDPLLARLGGGAALVANMLTLYVGAALYLLLATFIGHLVIRGFWIALLGLRSVFPEGPDFDRLRGGPIARDVARRNTPRTEDEIERLDNLATIVFMFGAMAVVGALIPGVFVLPMLAATWFWPDAPVGLLLMVTFGVFMGPMVVAASIDSLFGRHLDRNRRVARSLAAVLDFYQRLTQTRFTNALTTTLMTRLGFGRFMASYMFILMAVLLGYAAHSVMRRDGIAIGDYHAIPARADSGFAVLPQHYRDQRRDSDRLQRACPSWIRLCSRATGCVWSCPSMPRGTRRRSPNIVRTSGPACPCRTRRNPAKPRQHILHCSAVIATSRKSVSTDGPWTCCPM